MSDDLSSPTESGSAAAAIATSSLVNTQRTLVEQLVASPKELYERLGSTDIHTSMKNGPVISYVSPESPGAITPRCELK
jgi:hypothetical protein